MGEADIVNQIVQFVPDIDFTKTNSQVSLFETTIRYLAGLLSGYDFLGPQGPRSNLLKNGLVRYKSVIHLIGFPCLTLTFRPHSRC